MTFFTQQSNEWFKSQIQHSHLSILLSVTSHSSPFYHVDSSLGPIRALLQLVVRMSGNSCLYSNPSKVTIFLGNILGHREFGNRELVVLFDQ